MQVAQDAPLRPSMDIFAVGWEFSFLSISTFFENFNFDSRRNAEIKNVNFYY